MTKEEFLVNIGGIETVIVILGIIFIYFIYLQYLLIKHNNEDDEQ